jgi:regulator of protease activity HflC (stomatin/prohibitin superfamily)
VAERRTLAQVQEDAARLAGAGSHGSTRAAAQGTARDLASEAYRIGKAEAEARYRPFLAKAWSAYLDLFLSNRDLVNDIRYGEPELWARLCDAILGEPRG